MESYEDAIYAKAVEKGISRGIVYEYFERVIERITLDHRVLDIEERLARAERAVWGHFCESLLTV
jgi:hypothetical protein